MNSRGSSASAARFGWIFVAPSIAVAASPEVESQLRDMQARMQRMEGQLQAASDQVDTANQRVEEQSQVIENSGLVQTRGAGSFYFETAYGKTGQLDNIGGLGNRDVRDDTGFYVSQGYVQYVALLVGLADRHRADRHRGRDVTATVDHLPTDTLMIRGELRFDNIDKESSDNAEFFQDSNDFDKLGGE